MNLRVPMLSLRPIRQPLALGQPLLLRKAILNTSL